jgi:hypothetical protein
LGAELQERVNTRHGLTSVWSPGLFSPLRAAESIACGVKFDVTHIFHGMKVAGGA